MLSRWPLQVFYQVATEQDADQTNPYYLALRFTDGDPGGCYTSRFGVWHKET